MDIHLTGKKAAKRTPLSYFSTGIFLGTVVFGTSKLFGFLLKLIVSRLGVTEFGLYYYVVSIFASAVHVISLGLPMSFTRFLSFTAAKNQKTKQQSIIQSIFLFILLISSFIVIVGIISATKLSVMLSLPDPTTALLLVLAIPPTLITLIIQAGFMGLLQLKANYLTEALITSSKFMFVCTALWIFHTGTSGAIRAYSFTMIVVAIIPIYMFRNHLSIPVFPLHISKELVLYSWPVSLSQVLTSLSNIAYLTLIKRYGGQLEVGLYGAAVSIAALINILPQIVLPIFLPVVSSLYGAGKNIITLYKKIAVILSATTVIFVSVLIFMRHTIIRVLFGLSYIKSAETVMYLLLAYTGYIVFVWYNRQILDMAGYTAYNFLLTVVRIFVTLTVLFTSTSFTGVGLATALGLGWLIEGILCVVFIYKKQLLTRKRK